MNERILIVDDDAAIRATLAEHFSSEGYDVEAVETAETGLNRVHSFDPALVVTDVRMPGMSGIELTRRLRELRPDTCVLVITAFEDMDTAVATMRAGAYDMLVKPLDLTHLELVVERCLRDRALQGRARAFAADAAGEYAVPRLVGRDPRMLEIYKLIGTVASSRAPVLIRGETGTGKEVIARAIHFNSDVAEEPFVAVNCTALPETLLESELFGHVRGAFTGAARDRRGRFELAGSGTIFLDEIGDTTPSFQAKLLRVLQEREYEPLGSERTRRTEARVIAATHRPLEERVRQGEFREDLYFRLRVVEIEVPPLRERSRDIPLLARHLLGRIAADLHRPLHLPDAVAEALVAHDWPGNVRELENAITRAAVLSRGGIIDVHDLALGSSPRADRSGAMEPGRDVTASLADVERAHVIRVLRAAGGNKRNAARTLRVSRPRLDRLLARHGIEASEYDARGIEA